MNRSGENYQRKNFQEKEKIEIRKKKEKPVVADVNLPAGFWKKFLIFSVLAIFILGFLGAYLFIPKAKITVFTDTKEYSADVEIKANVSTQENNVDQATIPAQAINFEEEMVDKFSASGEKEISNQKARGTITIYNEYTEETQPLVATTRFLTEDDKLFRLVEGVEVPGMTETNGEIKPGAIEAQVVADEAGKEYNIEPSTFSIPGFKSSGQEKYSKIYAKSFESMTGGGDGNNKVATITEEDISSAKNKLLSRAKEEALEKLKDKAGSDSLILEEAVNFNDATYKTSHSAGEVSEEFSITIDLVAEALSVSRKNLQEVSASIIESENKEENPTLSISKESVTLELGKADVDFENKNILFRIHAIGKATLEASLDNLKEQMLGKSEAEIENLISSYPEIDKVVVDYWPPFLSGKIPSYAKRVDIVLDKNN